MQSPDTADNHALCDLMDVLIMEALEMDVLIMEGEACAMHHQPKKRPAKRHSKTVMLYCPFLWLVVHCTCLCCTHNQVLESCNGVKDSVTLSQFTCIMCWSHTQLAATCKKLGSEGRA